MNEWNEKVLTYHNDIRKKHNLKPIEHSKRICQECNIHTENMKSKSNLYHQCKPTTLQNVAYSLGTKFVEKPSKFIDLWYNHEGHRKTILDPKIQYIGSSYSYDQNNKGIYVCCNYE